MGGREALAKRHAMLKKLADTTISVGVHKDAGVYADGTPVASVAVINHFGSLDGRIPSRPFMTVARRESSAAIKAKMMEAVKLASEGKDGSPIFEVAGHYLADQAKAVIDSTSRLTPNAFSTIARKGRNHPLYETGRLRNSITVKTKGV